MIIYCVSGDEDIEPSSDNLRATGRSVLHGEAVDPDALRVLQPGGTFVVVAHGNGEAVFFRRGVAEPRSEWLWVGMNPAPAGARLYLYCCKAGLSLAPYLAGCNCLGHSDIVPMPVDDDADEVISFLDKVDEVLGEGHLGPAELLQALKDFAARRFQDALRSATEQNFRAVVIWQMLSRSLA